MKTFTSDTPETTQPLSCFSIEPNGEGVADDPEQSLDQARSLPQEEEGVLLSPAQAKPDRALVKSPGR